MHKQEIVVYVRDQPSRDKAAIKAHITTDECLGFYQTHMIPVFKEQKVMLKAAGQKWSVVHVPTGIRIAYTPTYKVSLALIRRLSRLTNVHWDFTHQRGVSFPEKLRRLLPAVRCSLSNVLDKKRKKKATPAKTSAATAPTEQVSE